MKNYLQTIKKIQLILLALSFVVMIGLPLVITFFPDILTDTLAERLFDISHIAVFFVMMIRPLADIFLKISWIRPLVILRKGVGVLSASIPASFLFAKLMIDGSAYLSGLGTSAYWSLGNFALLAHLADISALALLVTSNNLSKKLLGKNWKRIQRLSYVYFYASSLYALYALHNTSVIVSLLLVTVLTIGAFVKNRARRTLQTPLQTRTI